MPVKQKQIAMLKSFDKDTKNPERASFTAGAMNRQRKRVILNSPEQRDSTDWGTFSTLRPRTTPLLNRTMHETLNSTVRSSNLVHLRSISVVQSQLNDRYKEDMNPYLRKKFRKFIERKQENFVPERAFDSTIETNQLQSTGKYSARRPIEHFYSAVSNEGKLQIEKGVDEAYLLTAKERIVRLIQMKKERETLYKSLNSKIKAQRVSNEQAKGKNRFDEFKRQTIEEQDWDQRWREDNNRENKRYRNRLVIKCNKQTNPFFSLVN